MRPEKRRSPLRLVTPPEPGPVDLHGDELPEDSSEPRMEPLIGGPTTDVLARMCWAMRLHALIGKEAERAVDTGILTVPEAEVLVARLAVVIDQAVGADDN